MAHKIDATMGIFAVFTADQPLRHELGQNVAEAMDKA
jgi:hypothetical protein